MRAAPRPGSAAAVVETLRRTAAMLVDSPFRAGSVVELPDRGRLLATGDLHDNPHHLERITAIARLDAAPDRHVVLHEIVHSDRLINGVDLSHRTLARAAALVAAHPRQVHLLLANHELAQLTGQGVSKGAGDSVRLFDEGLDFAFGDAADEVAEAVKSLIRAMPLAARSASGLLCAHSLPDENAPFDPAVLGRALRDEDYRPGGSAYQMVWGRRYAERQLDQFAPAGGRIRLACLGHASVPAGIEARGHRIIVLNSDHDQGAVLPIDLAHVPDAEQAMASAVRLGSVAP